MNTYFLYGLGQCIANTQKLTHIAELSGVSIRQLSKIAHGQCECRIQTLEKINTALHNSSIEQYIDSYPEYYLEKFQPLLQTLVSLEPETQYRLIQDIKTYSNYLTTK